KEQPDQPEPFHGAVPTTFPKPLSLLALQPGHFSVKIAWESGSPRPQGGRAIWTHPPDGCPCASVTPSVSAKIRDNDALPCSRASETEQSAGLRSTRVESRFGAASTPPRLRLRLHVTAWNGQDVIALGDREHSPARELGLRSKLDVVGAGAGRPKHRQVGSMETPIARAPLQETVVERACCLVGVGQHGHPQRDRLGDARNAHEEKNE